MATSFSHSHLLLTFTPPSQAVYSKLFDYLIVKINDALIAGGEAMSETDARVIGVVDIFGFEVFKVNPNPNPNPIPNPIPLSLTPNP